MQFVTIKPAALAAIRVLAGDYAERYIAEGLLPSLGRPGFRNLEGIRQTLLDPYESLEAIFSHYAFTRRGKERAELTEMALLALYRTTSKQTIASFLELPDASTLWQNFEAVCAERKKRPLEQLNRGVISGLAELAQEVYRLDSIGSITGWILTGVEETGRIEPQFLRMVDVRGVGPKLTSLLLRDLMYIFALEERLDHVDRLYVQPVDKWIRLIAPYLVDEPGIEDAADWILAGKLAKYARRSGVSGIRFNMGATYFGIREVKIPDHLPESMSRLSVSSSAVGER